MSELHRIVSYWDGARPLHYLHHISLLSFVDKGHEVTLYTLPQNQEKLNVPKGVDVQSVDAFWPGISERLSHHIPATASDLLRILLNSELGAIWVDTDVIALQPLSKELDYIFATEARQKIKPGQKGNLNNAVLKLPSDSEGLKFLREFVLAVLKIEPARTEFVLDYINSPKGHPIFRYGPRALTLFLTKTGELRYQLEPKAIYPVHFNLSDCYWDPDVDVQKRFTDESLVTHIWDSQVRPGWYRREALPGSFIAMQAERYGVDMAALKRKK